MLDFEPLFFTILGQLITHIFFEKNLVFHICILKVTDSKTSTYLYPLHMAKKIRTLTQMAFSFDEPETAANAEQEDIAAPKAPPTAVAESTSTPASETIGFRIKSIKTPVIAPAPVKEVEPLVEMAPLPELFPTEEFIVLPVQNEVPISAIEEVPPITLESVTNGVEPAPSEIKVGVLGEVIDSPKKVRKPAARVKSVAPKSSRGRKSIQSQEQSVAILRIPEDEILFQKQYYPIGEVAEMFGVNTSLIRFWTNEFEMIKPRLNRKGDRLFRPIDIKNLLLIHELLRGKKLTIQGAKQYLKTEKKAPTPPTVDTLTTLTNIRTFLVELKTMLS